MKQPTRTQGTAAADGRQADRPEPPAPARPLPAETRSRRRLMTVRGW